MNTVMLWTSLVAAVDLVATWWVPGGDWLQGIIKRG